MKLVYDDRDIRRLIMADVSETLDINNEELTALKVQFFQTTDERIEASIELETSIKP